MAENKKHVQLETASTMKEVDKLRTSLRASLYRMLSFVASGERHTQRQHTRHHLYIHESRTSGSGPADAPFSSNSRPTRSREALHVTKAAVALHSPPPTPKASPLLPSPPPPPPAASSTIMKAGPGGGQRPDSSPPVRLATDKIPFSSDRIGTKVKAETTTLVRFRPLRGGLKRYISYQ